VEAEQEARKRAEIAVLGHIVYEAEDYGELTEVEAGMITRCAEAISAAQRVAIKECLEEVVDTQRGLTSEREYTSEIVGGIENRIRALIKGGVMGKRVKDALTVIRDLMAVLWAVICDGCSAVASG